MTSPLQDSGESHQDTGRMADALRHTAETAFTTRNDSRPTSVATPGQVTEACAAPERRILPDLTSEDPLNALLRREAERRASLDNRHGSRRKKTNGAQGQVDRVKENKLVQEKVHNQRVRRGPEPVKAIPVTKKAASPESVRIRPERTPPIIAKRKHKASGRRGAYRLAGNPDALRPGERWKRRLPQICW